jgi:hypothetical protein
MEKYCPNCEQNYEGELCPNCIVKQKGKFYLQKLEGTFHRFNLSTINENNEEEFLAHAYQVPKGGLTEYFMPEHKDFSLHWYKGEALTSDGHGYGGHHLGEMKEISKEEADEIINKIEPDNEDDIGG